jgi:predicted transcriptional regulator
MTSLKSQILEVANALPDDCTLDDFRERLYLQLKAQEGLAAIEAGQTFTREQVAEQIKSWRKSFGQRQP